MFWYRIIYYYLCVQNLNTHDMRVFFSWISWNGCRDDNRFVYDIQLTTPSEPAMAVSMAINILSSLLQSKEPPLPTASTEGEAAMDEFWVFLFTCLIFSLTFISVSIEDFWVCRGIPCGCPVGVGAGSACPSVVGADRCVCPIMCPVRCRANTSVRPYVSRFCR